MPLPIDVILGSAGGILVIAGLTWRSVARIREDRQVERGLDDPDPVVRTDVICAATAHGMRRHAARLVRRVLAEEDPNVLDALALAVAHNQWEPVDRGAMVALRQWVHQRGLPHSERDDDLVSGPPADPPGRVIELSDNVTSAEPYLLGDEVADRFGFPLTVLVHGVESGDITAPRIASQDGVHSPLPLATSALNRMTNAGGSENGHIVAELGRLRAFGQITQHEFETRRAAALAEADDRLRLHHPEPAATPAKSSDGLLEGHPEPDAAPAKAPNGRILEELGRLRAFGLITQQEFETQHEAALAEAVDGPRLRHPEVSASSAIGDVCGEALDGNAGPEGGEGDEGTALPASSSPEGIVEFPPRRDRGCGPPAIRRSS